MQIVTFPEDAVFVSYDVTDSKTGYSRAVLVMTANNDVRIWDLGFDTDACAVARLMRMVNNVEVTVDRVGVTYFRKMFGSQVPW